MPEHVPMLCPECGSPLTASGWCSSCEAQREVARPRRGEPEQERLPRLRRLIRRVVGWRRERHREERT